MFYFFLQRFYVRLFLLSIYSASFNVMSVVKECQYLDSLFWCFRVSNHCLSKVSLEWIPRWTPPETKRKIQQWQTLIAKIKRTHVTTILPYTQPRLNVCITKPWLSKYWLSSHGYQSIGYQAMVIKVLVIKPWLPKYWLLSHGYQSIGYQAMVNKVLVIKPWLPTYWLMVTKLWLPKYWLPSHGYQSIGYQDMVTEALPMKSFDVPTS